MVGKYSLLEKVNLIENDIRECDDLYDDDHAKDDNDDGD